MDDPGAINELLASYNANCLKAETHALDIVSSCEIAIFNGFRNATAQSCLKALNQLSIHFGREHNAERCLCLAILTEYICSSYRNTLLYKTFEIPLAGKFIEKIFNKLYTEWMKVFLTELPEEFIASPQFQCIPKLLKSCVDRFPNTFCHKSMLEEIVSQSEAYWYYMKRRSQTANIQTSLPIKKCNLSASQETRPSSATSNIIENRRVETMVPKPTNQNNYDISQYVIRKASIAPQGFQTTRISNFTNSIGSIIEARIPPAPEPCNRTDNDLLKGETIPCTLELSSEGPTLPTKKLNAFDILMRKSGAVKSKLKI